MSAGSPFVELNRAVYEETGVYLGRSFTSTQGEECLIVYVNPSRGLVTYVKKSTPGDRVRVRLDEFTEKYLRDWKD